MLVDEPYLETELCCCTLEILDGLAADEWRVLTQAQGDRGCRKSGSAAAAYLRSDPPPGGQW